MIELNSKQYPLKMKHDGELKMSDWKTKDQKIHNTENEETRLGNIMADLATFYSLHHSACHNLLR